ncbi:otolin-1-A-like [Saccostrea echinata]|uniref:otolin-1-A-like n=1 Tax=Saccostrea echinata TaxID=191078 RepID=UPI002A7F5DB2|nr:otolin-1-A-like [Saccostrea echinata]
MSGKCNKERHKASNVEGVAIFLDVVPSHHNYVEAINPVAMQAKVAQSHFAAEDNLPNSVSVAFTAGVRLRSSSWSGGILVFDKVINNVGDGYNLSNGIFTAPTGGNYMFYVSIQSDSNNADIWIDIVLNGSSKARAIAEVFNSNVGYETGTNMVTLRLKQGGQVWIKHNHGKGYYTQLTDAPITTFSGFLI